LELKVFCLGFFAKPQRQQQQQQQQQEEAAPHDAFGEWLSAPCDPWRLHEQNSPWNNVIASKENRLESNKHATKQQGGVTIKKPIQLE